MKPVAGFWFLLLCCLLGRGEIAEAHETSPRFYRDLVRRYAPVWIQEIGPKPAYDFLTRFDFDGDETTSNNVDHAPGSSLPAAVYGGVIAETGDSYYLFYGVYHVADYDSPLREFFFSSAKHDNDFEGAIVAVAKGSGGIRAVETWFHSRFLQFAPSSQQSGSQALDGKIHVEDGTHPVLLVQDFGHGVRAFQKIDEPYLKTGSYQIYRTGRKATKFEDAHSPFVEYRLEPLDDFSRFARGPFGEEDLFSDPQDFGIGGAPFGKYFSGRFSGDSSWARPKPPWSWCDKFDTFRPGAWFFHPARVFNRHFNLHLSERYLFNFAKDHILKVDQQSLDEWVNLKIPAYFNDIPHGLLHRPLQRIRKVLYGIADYLFYLLG